ncbi:MAG: FAD-dependent oxidoreductase [Deltaproteobacteria bacterium]|nr:FAD-dependent oxidoreductase [Deltaproteobacteria bacterium]MBW2298692.1 FAD-dependent oxidoreductase [Deltaproteobacteria bacterium]
MKELKADVVVIAAGVSGLASAIAAAEGGVNVIVFEKAPRTGGAGNMGMGPLAVESRLQRLKQHGPTKDEAFRTFMEYTHWRVDARLVRAYLNKSADTIDWLERMGVEFVEPAAYFRGAHFTWHLVKPASGQPGPMASATMTKIMTDRAKQLGVDILLRTPARKIQREGGRITGVIAEDKSGQPIQAKAKAVIVATGGFGDNPEIIKKFTGFDCGRDLFPFRIPGLNGDGIQMAWEVGAAPTEMTMELIYGFSKQLEPNLQAALRQPHLMVNLLGERFMDEAIMANTTYTGNAISRQKGRCAFLIFDENTKKHMETVGFDNISVVFPFMKIENMDVAIKNALDQGFREIYVADSLEELAKKTGIDASGLHRTVDEYNECCEKGYDNLFNKNHRYLRPVKVPKFYAAKHFPSAYGSLGGIKINHRTEVLDKEWKVIPGLYAVGTDACTIYGDSYVFILPGNTMGFALNSGRIAGENAAEYVRSLGE